MFQMIATLNTLSGHHLAKFLQPFHNVTGLLLIYCLFFQLDGERCDRHSRGYFGGDCNQCSTTGWGRYWDKTTFLVRTFVQDAHLLPLLRRTFDGTFQAGQHLLNIPILSYCQSFSKMLRNLCSICWINWKPLIGLLNSFKKYMKG